MGFLARKKTVAEFETEASLPSFSIDANGFIMFDDPDLGGAAVMEITSAVRTEGITHRDPADMSISTEDPAYVPSTDTLFADRRKDVYGPWVAFLNSLHASNPADDPIHIQILVKKCLSDEWITRLDYAAYEFERAFGRILYPPASARNPKKPPRQQYREALRQERARDYLDILEYMRWDANEREARGFPDLRNIPSYSVKFYLIISYTPSSEGWWMDGRDNSYYVNDSVSATNMFSADEKVENIADLIMRRRNRKEARDDSGNEEDFFWIASDRTSQVLFTRVRKVEDFVAKWNRNHVSMPMPFRLRRLSDDREAAAIVRFFPNLLTPYWEKIGRLKANRNDVLTDINKGMATARRDGDALVANAEDIVRGQVKVQHSRDEREAFLAGYRNKTADEVRNLAGDYDARTWTVEKHERKQKAAEIRKQQLAEADGIWKGFGGSDLVEDEYKTEAQKRQEFLDSFKNRAPSVEYAQFNDEILKERNRKTREGRRRENQIRQREEMKKAEREQSRKPKRK